MPKQLNFAVVGLGMGGHHCKAIMNAKGAQLTAVCDTDEERLDKWAKEGDCKAYKSYAKLLKDPDVDVINMCTESGKHVKMCIQAAEAGKHIIVEKPVDIKPDRITKLQKVIGKTGVKCGCIFQSRMENVNIMLRKAIQKGYLGDLVGAHAWLPWYREQSYYEGPHGSWKGTWRWDGGGSLMNQGIHTVDVLIFLAGEVEAVCGFYGAFGHDIEAEDQTVAILKYKNGALGTLFTTTCCQPDGDRRVQFYGTKGSFYLNGGTFENYDAGPPKHRERMMKLFGGKKAKSGISSDPMAVSADGHMLIVEDLVKAVRQDREPAIPLQDARHAVDVACAIYKSARTGKAVRVASMVK